MLPKPLPCLLGLFPVSRIQEIQWGLCPVSISNDPESIETINAIFDCIKVKTKKDYNNVIAKFEKETADVQNEEKVEVETRFLLSDRYFIHDRYSMIIFRVTDSEGHPITDYDLLLTAGENNDPNHLPEGFFVDRQQNKNNRSIVTYYIDYDIMEGSDEVKTDNKIIRNETLELICLE